MVVVSEEVSVSVSGSRMRVAVARPRARGRWPGVVMCSDIFQITGAQDRTSRRLAGYGFVVATHEIWHRVEPAGAAIAFDDAGRTRGLANAGKTRVAEFDADLRAVLDHLKARDDVADRDRLGAVGFCIGGHLALRAALNADVRATAAFYPTGVHDGTLGADADAGTLARLSEIEGELLLVFGTRDPHVPAEGRDAIARALASSDAGTRATTKLYDAEHAFMRDEGPRYDPEATDDAFAELVRFLRRASTEAALSDERRTSVEG